MKPPIDVFDLVDKLTADRPLRRASVEHTLGVPLREDEEQNSPVVTIYSGGPAGGWLDSVELRAPTEEDINDVSQLTLELADAPWPSETEMYGKLGRDCRVDVPTPREPDSAPLNYSFAKPWGRVSFGYSRQAPERLSRIIVSTKNTKD